MCVAGALRGEPASTTSTLRPARARTRAPDSPAAPPPMTATSYELMCTSLEPCSAPDQRRLLYPGKPESDEPMDGTPSARETSAAIALVLNQVGPRLKQVRTRRRLTLTG